ncbi:PAS domain S-box protein [Acidimangrovimonas sediminis]|uniref:PAS domain S-box protein n=1 Tax=Acidimangrovimonas sediminis TaxID=2056283 RepID=UPI001304EFD7|nr:PAS domain S-box protein [Acidimangrovimonas sediminis]
MSMTAGLSRDESRRTVLGWTLTLACYLALCCGGLVLKPSYADALALPRGAGFALAILMIYGRNRWPAVLAVSILARLIVTTVAGEPLALPQLEVALAIGALQALRAWLSATIILRMFGTPLKIAGTGHLLRCLALVGPVLGMATAAIGIALYIALGQSTGAGILGNWLVWWVGDTLGIITVTGVVFFWPSRASPQVYWRGTPMPRFRSASFAYVLVSLAMTLTAWQAMNSLMVHFQRKQFEMLVRDNGRTVEDRLNAYAVSLLGARGFLDSSAQVTASQWRNFVQGLDLPLRVPGLRGLGFAAPDGKAIPVRLIEAHDGALETPGFDLGAVEAWRAAADAARDTGQIRISDRGTGPGTGPGGISGMMLFVPVYGRDPTTGRPPATVAARRATLRGWVFAPIATAAFFSDIASNQPRDIEVSLYASGGLSPGSLIYSDAEPNPNRRPVYSTTHRIEAFGQSWPLVSESAPSFENGMNRAAPAVTLAAGMAFTVVLTIYLLSLGRREVLINQKVANRTRELAAQIEENRSIIQTPNANIALLDEEGSVLFVNDSVKALLGRTQDDLFARPLSEILGREARDYFAMARLSQEPPNFRRELRAADGRGGTLILDVQINPWSTAEGYRRFTTLITDVTDKRRVETELRDARNRLDVALTGAKIGVFEVDLATRLAIVSPTWKELFGFAPDAPIDGQAEFRQRIHPEDFPGFRANDRACIEGRAERSINEFRMLRVDGSWRWLRSEAVAGERDGRGVATRLIGATTDITELVESKEALRQSEERFRSAFEAAPVGMAIIMPEGRFAKVNDALTRLVGISAEDALRTPFHAFIHPEERPRIRALVGMLLTGEQQSFETDMRCLHADGSDVWGRLSLAIVRSKEGQPETFVIQVHDLTEQHRAERVKNEFIATVSHELRTPLTSINGSLGLLLNGVAGAIPDRARSMLTIAQKNCSRLILLVNDILDMEKLVSRKMSFEMTRASIPRLVQQAIANTQPFADQSAVRFIFTPPRGRLVAQVDVNRFQQVMANLLSNAVKFSQPGATVEIATEAEDGMIRVSVTDHGAGVPASFHGKIFTAFSQADSSSTRAKAGTGLGLSISREIVEQMGGTIGFDSVPDVATTFWFTLPREAPLAAPGIAPRPAAPAAPDRGPRILHIEPDGDFAQIVGASFGTRAALFQARDWTEALNRAAGESFDLVLIDEIDPPGGLSPFLDAIEAQLGTVPMIALAADDATVTDPRIRRLFVKTRAGEEQVVAACLAAIGTPPSRA